MADEPVQPAGPARPVNVTTANVQQANIHRVTMTRHDPNTGESKEGDTVILTDINQALGKIDDTFKEYLTRLEKTIREGDKNRAKDAPDDPEPEKEDTLGDKKSRIWLKKISEQLGTLARLNEDMAKNLDLGPGTSKVGGSDRKKSGEAHDEYQIRLQRNQAHFKKLQELQKAHETKIKSLNQAYQAGTIGFGQFLGQMNKVSLTYNIHRSALNSLNKTTNKLRSSFTNLTQGVDAWDDLIKPYFKDRYNADGGYKTMVQSGYGGAKEAFFDDMVPNINRDSLYQTSIAMRRNSQRDGTNELLSGGQSLTDAAKQMHESMKGVSSRGYSLLDRMGRDEAKDALMDIAGTLRRGGIIDRLNDTKSMSLMTEQLKVQQLAAANTAATVREVQKNTEELRRRAGNLVGSGRLTGDQAALSMNMGALVHNSPELKDLITRINDSGQNFAIFADKNQDLVKDLLARRGGDIEDLKDVIEQMRTGQGDANDLVSRLVRGVKTTGGSANQDVLSFMDADKFGLGGAANAFTSRQNKTDTTETTLFGIYNRFEQFIKETVPWDTLKMVAGVGLMGASLIKLVLSNTALIAAINANTLAHGGSLGGLLGGAKGGLKGILGKGAGMVGGAAAGIGSMFSGAGGALAGMLGLGGAGVAGAAAMARGPATGGTATTPSPTPAASAGRSGVVGKVGKFMKGIGPAALVGSLALPVVDSMTPEFKGKDTLMSGAQGALIGATIGSFVPVVGTLVGAAIGGGLGMLSANLDSLMGAQADQEKTPTVATPPSEGWSGLSTTLTTGFASNANATREVTQALMETNRKLQNIHEAVQKSGQIVKTSVGQTGPGAMRPGVQMF